MDEEKKKRFEAGACVGAPGGVTDGLFSPRAIETKETCCRALRSLGVGPIGFQTSG